MRDVEAAIGRLASRQHGVITAAQLRGLGLTHAMVRHRVESGALVRLWRGVYRLGGAPVTRLQLHMAAAVAAGPGVLVSHRAAAELWGLDGVAPSGPELLTSSMDHVRLPGVISHRWRMPLIDEDRASRHGIPVTSTALTIVGLASVVSPAVVELALDSAIDRRLATLSDVVAAAGRHCGRGFAGSATLRALFAGRASTERGESSLHRRIVRELARLRVPLGVDEHEVEIGGRLLRIDHAWPEAALALEVLGRTAHGGAAAFHRDPERRNLLLGAGWTTLEATSRTHILRLADQIRAHLTQPRTLPVPTTLEASAVGNR